MSTSLLYHAFGIRGYEYQRTDYVSGEVYFTMSQERERLRCPSCGSAQVTAHGVKNRCFRSVPIGGKATHVILDIARVECVACRITRQVQVPFADAKRTYTHAFERYALDLCRHMTMQDVARHLDVSWDVIKDMQKRHLQQRYAKPKLKRLKRLAIDEIAVAKGHRYLTVVLNLDSGVVVFVGDGKGAAALKPFWKRLRGSGATLCLAYASGFHLLSVQGAPAKSTQSADHDGGKVKGNPFSECFHRRSVVGKSFIPFIAPLWQNAWDFPKTAEFA